MLSGVDITSAVDHFVQFSRVEDTEDEQLLSNQATDMCVQANKRCGPSPPLSLAYLLSLTLVQPKWWKDRNDCLMLRESRSDGVAVEVMHADIRCRGEPRRLSECSASSARLPSPHTIAPTVVLSCPRQILHCPVAVLH